MEIVLRRHEVLVDGRAVGRRDAASASEILDPDRQAKQRTTLTGRAVVGERGFGESALGDEGTDGIDLRIDPLDLLEMGLHDLARRDVARAQQQG